jgi:hypothetical protein
MRLRLAEQVGWFLRCIGRSVRFSYFVVFSEKHIERSLAQNEVMREFPCLFRDSNGSMFSVFKGSARCFDEPWVLQLSEPSWRHSGSVILPSDDPWRWDDRPDLTPDERETIEEIERCRSLADRLRAIET